MEQKTWWERSLDVRSSFARIGWISSLIIRSWPWYPSISTDDNVELGASPPGVKDGDMAWLMDIVGDGGPEDNGESSSSGHTDLVRSRSVKLKQRGADFLEFVRCCKAARADAVGVKEPWASYASGCKVTRAESVFKKSSVTLDCVAEHTDVSETVRLRCSGRSSGRVAERELWRGW